MRGQLSLGFLRPIPASIRFRAIRDVLRGEAFLDGKAREGKLSAHWRSMISEKTLDIKCGASCIAAQLSSHKDYKAGCCDLGLDYNTNEPARFGFDIQNVNVSDEQAAMEFEARRRAWLLVLRRPAHSRHSRQIEKPALAA